MLRGGSVLKLHELRAQGKSIREIARITGYSRNTVRKYLRNCELPTDTPRQRPRRPSKLEPYLDELHFCMNEGIFNCEVLLEKLQAKGYTGSQTILIDYVKRFRPPRRAKAVMPYETEPGEQAQVDWGVFKYRDEHGHERKVNGFAMSLGYSRDMYVEFTNRAYQFVLALHDQRLTALRRMHQVHALRQPEDRRAGAERMRRTQMEPTVCRLCPDNRVYASPVSAQAAADQTKGKVESGIKYVKHNFWPGRRFTDLKDLISRPWLGVSKRAGGSTVQLVNGRVTGALWR